MNKDRRTYTAKKHEIQRGWYELDASTIPLGRAASKIAKVLQGKHKPQYTPNIDVGDFVIVTNVEKVPVTGNKENEKVYYRHSWYPGGLKGDTVGEQRTKDPKKLLEKAVYGMLPKNKLRNDRMKRLKLIVGSEHEHKAQKPKKLEV